MSYRTAPSVAGRRPVIARSSVVFPAPLGPMTAIRLRSPIGKLTRSIRTLSPTRTVRSCATRVTSPLSMNSRSSSPNSRNVAGPMATMSSSVTGARGVTATPLRKVPLWLFRSTIS